MITLEVEEFPVNRELGGTDAFVLSAGDTLKIESGGVEYLNGAEVPEGKEWQVYLTVRIEETNA